MIFIFTGCTNKIKVVPRAFNPSFSSSSICEEQGITSSNPQYLKCINFYNFQNNKNRRNILLGFGVALAGAILFQNECDCFLGPDRGTKFIP